jgi:hypothetical protein
MVTQLVFETHAISEDNERAVASGWHHSRLSARRWHSGGVHV